jgi:hypothetical protein
MIKNDFRLSLYIPDYKSANIFSIFLPLLLEIGHKNFSTNLIYNSTERKIQNLNKEKI